MEPSGRKLYRLQFSLQAASPETIGYALVCRPAPPYGGQRYFYLPFSLSCFIRYKLHSKSYSNTL